MSKRILELEHPNLKRAPYFVTSKEDAGHNCIAYAAGDTTRWWWPFNGATQAYWPAGVPRQLTLAAFVAAFATLGYSPCADGDVEAGYEKVAIFVSPQGAPTHAAKQLLRSGRWSSKMGPLEDINHSIYGVSDKMYGEVGQYMRRPLQSVSNPAG